MTSTSLPIPPYKRFMRRVLMTIIILPPALFALWAWGSLKYVYARGERAGYVQKFSQKGWVIKTWEGELAMVNLPGAMPEIFHFTVRDEPVAEKITRAMGQRVALNYEQHRGLPGNLFGDTEYFVVGVTAVADPSSSSTRDHPVSL
jgi:hypothetical protein